MFLNMEYTFLINSQFHKEVSVNVQSIMYYADWHYKVYCLGEVREDWR